GNPTGGVFSGSGVTGDDFDPAVAGAGVHNLTYTYTDANGCINSATQDIEVFPLPVVTMTDPSDVCIDNGLVALSGNPTSGLFLGIGVNGNTFDPTAAGAGVHSITYVYTDANGCINSATQDVEVFSLPELVFSLPAGFCINNGLLDLDATPIGGTYTGTGIVGDQFDPLIAGLGLHNLTYTFQDGNGCINTISAEIEVYGIPSVAVSSNSPVCELDEILLEENGGDAVSWQWEGPNGYTSIEQMAVNSTVSLADAGTYTVTITDGNGCSAIDAVEVLIFTLPEIAVGSNSPVCPGSSLQLFENGNGGVFWDWNGPEGFNESGQNVEIANMTEVNEGAYTVQKFNIYGCTSTGTVDVVVLDENDPACINCPGTLSLNGIQASAETFCPEEDVELFADATGGIGTLTYEWITPDGIQSGNPVTVQSGGNYIVNITDEVSCQVTSTISLDQLPLPVVIIETNSIICAGDEIQLMETGTEAISWNWTGPNNFASAEQNPLIENAGELNSGTYAVEIIGLNGCVNIGNVEIIVSPLPVVMIGNNSHLCTGENLLLFETGGDAVSWYWSGPDGFISTEQNPMIPDATLANAGTYSITITDVNTCTSSGETEVSIGITPSINISSNSPIQTGNTIELYETGGEATNWMWSGPDGFVSNEQNPIIPNVGLPNEGTYFVTIINTEGCDITSSIDVVVDSELAVAGMTSPVCEGEDLMLTEVGGLAVGWFWAGPEGFTSSEQNPLIQDVTTLASGWYYITATDAAGFTEVDSTQVTVYPSAVAAIQSNSQVCEGADLELLETGTDAVSWLWDGPGGFTSNQQNPLITSVDQNNAGTYSVTITNANGCTSAVTSNVEILNSPATTIIGTAELCTGEDLILSEESGNAVAWTWVGPNNFTSDQASFTINNVTNSNAGNYSVTITNTNGCENNTEIEVVVHDLPNIIVSTNSPLCLGETLELREEGT
ncbi:MAG: hypothetical protein GY751_05440, partial [Bacteroidetes bacterium]|nr:hypothetical protein [Bacteroidota bacterium]